MIQWLPLKQTLRRDLEDDSGALRTTFVRRAVEIPCLIGNQIAKGVQTIGAAGKDVKGVVGPGTACWSQLVNGSRAVIAVAVCCSANLARLHERVAESPRNIPSGQCARPVSQSRLAPFVTMLITEFSQVASECAGKALEVSRNHVQMVSRHSLDFETGRQIRPNRSRIPREVRVVLALYEFHIAAVRPWTITRQCHVRLVLDLQPCVRKRQS